MFVAGPINGEVSPQIADGKAASDLTPYTPEFTFAATPESRPINYGADFSNSGPENPSLNIAVGLAPRPDEIRDFICKLGIVHVAAIKQEGGAVIGLYSENPDDQTNFAVTKNNQNRNIYYTYNKPVADCGNKPTKAQIEEIKGIHLDIDPPKDGSYFDKNAKIKSILIDAPTFIIDSGNGIQAIWIFDAPIRV